MKRLDAQTFPKAHGRDDVIIDISFKKIARGGLYRHTTTKSSETMLTFCLGPRRAPMRLSYFLPFVWALPLCLGGEVCSINKGSTTITAFCEAGCCSASCCKESDTEGVSTITIVMCALLGLIIILCIIIASIYLYRKKKPKCCYKNNEGDDDDEDIKVDFRRKSTDGLFLSPVQNGYSSKQSVDSTDHTRPVARPASPFTPMNNTVVGGAVAPVMTRPRYTNFSSDRTGFQNSSFMNSGDKTNVLAMKKQKPQTHKTVTFKNRIDSPRGSFDAMAHGKVRPIYPPILPPLHRQAPSRELEFENKFKDHTTDLPSSADTSPSPGQNTIYTSPTPSQSTTAPEKNISTNKEKPSSNDVSITTSVTKPVDVSNNSKTISPTRNETSFIKSNNHSPTMVQAASSSNSVNSIDSVDIDDKSRARTSSLSPYSAAPYAMKKTGRAFSPQSSNLSELSYDSGTFVSSLMRAKSAGKNTDSSN